MIERIAKLLALAEAAGTAAEAEAAFAKAQELASRHSVDLAVAQAMQKEAGKRETPETRTIRIGDKGKRANAPLVMLFSTVARANDVSILIAHDSTLVYPTGFPSDLDVVEALWLSLAPTMTKFADELVRDKNAAWRSEVVTVWDDRVWGTVEKKVTGQSARRTFSEGFISRIGERLQEVRDAAIRDAEVRHFHADGIPAEIGGGTANNLPTSMALVLRDKKNEVTKAQDEWYEARHGKRRAGSWKGGRSATTHSRSANAAGRAAADRASLSGRRAVGA